MMSNRNVRLALLQLAYAGSRDKMLDSISDRIRDAVDNGAQLICLQELCTSPYLCQTEDHTNFDYAEAVDGITVRRIQSLANEHEIVIVVPFFERRAAGVYHNSVAVIDADGTVAGSYRKMHIPDDPSYYEKFYFTPGDLGFRPIQTRYGKLGVGICWDQWFPEAARLLSLAGAEILLYPTAIGWLHDEKKEFGDGQHDAWQTSMRAHAIANGVWVGAANRVGVEDGIEFWGGSFIASPRGEIVGAANHTEESTVYADCNLDEIDAVRTHWPFLRDRRIDAYEDLVKRFID